MIKDIISQEIDKLRLEILNKKITIVALSKKVNLSRHAIYNILDKKSFNLETVHKIECAVKNWEV